MEDNSFGEGDRHKILVIGFFLLGIFVLAIGAGLFFFRNQGKGDDIQIISAQNAATQSASQLCKVSPCEAVVDIGGAVNRPGVYKLANNLRVNDAIAAAGGLAGDADTSKMNLAAKIGDGQKIYVPTKLDSSMVGRSVAGVSTLVNINSATEAELDSLPGVGPVSANKIIASRPYGSLEDLLSKKAISASVYAKIRDLISY